MRIKFGTKIMTVGERYFFEDKMTRFFSEENSGILGIIFLAGTFLCIIAAVNAGIGLNVWIITVFAVFSIIGLFMLGYRRTAFFDIGSGKFRLVKGWFFLRRVMEGDIKRIVRLRLSVRHQSGAIGQEISFTAIKSLYVDLQDKSFLISRGGAAAAAAVAKKLSKMLNCPLELPSAAEMVSPVDWKGFHKGVNYTVNSFDGVHTTIAIDENRRLTRGFQIIRGGKNAGISRADPRWTAAESLFDLGASLIDIGYSANAVFAEFPMDTVSIDPQTAQKALNILIGLKDASY